MYKPNKQIKFERIHSIEIKEIEQETFDITNYEKNVFMNEPNFFANSILVHNSVHASGVVITDEPIFKYIPVDRVGTEIVTAFPESGAEDTLDKLGCIKLDILGISILDVIKEAVDLIDEKMYLIEENSTLKIVPASYIDAEIALF